MATSMRTKRVAKERQKVLGLLPRPLSCRYQARIKDLSADHRQIDKFGLPPGIELVDGNDLKEWLFDIRVLDNNPLYNGNVYQLKFVFSDSYPIGNPVLPAPRITYHGTGRLTSISRTPRGHLCRQTSSASPHASTHLLERNNMS